MKKSGEGRAVNPLRWAPALVGLSSAAALVVAVQARTPATDVAPAPPPQPQTVEVMGPPKPEPPKIYGPPLPAELLARRSGKLAKQTPTPPSATGGLPGRIGPIGPIEGPLNAQVSAGGPLFGPSWDRKPLPRLPNSSQFVGPQLPTASPAKAGPAVARPVQPGASDADSELPDPTKLAISRAANPTVEVRDRAAVKAEASPEHPVSLSVSLGDNGSHTVGDVVVVRLTANVDSYFVVMRVDATGKATTVYQSSRPSQRLACVVKAGPEVGAEYLVAVGSVRALNSDDVTAALKSAGTGFGSMPAGAEAGSQPGQAWSAIVAHAGNVGGSATPARWQRHEWDVATTAFATVAKPEKPAAETEIKAAGAAVKPAAKSLTPKVAAAKGASPKVAATKTIPVRKPAVSGEGSTLPGGKPGEAAAVPEKSSEKSVEPTQGESPTPGSSVLPGG